MNYYKVMRRLNNNQLVSSFIDPADPKPFTFQGRKANWLKYSKNKVTVAHPNTLGVVCYRTFEDGMNGQDGTYGNTCRKSIRPFKHTELWEVEPIGEEMDRDGVLNGYSICFHAIKLIKRILP